jgi:hypothetical protein
VSAPAPGDLVGTAVRTYDPRGPLQQHRLPTSHTFTCWRCGSTKTSKLITVVDTDPQRLLCNGCYGQLLSLWEIKAGDLPDEDRDRAVLQLLAKSVPAGQVAAARRRLQNRTAVYSSVSDQAQLMLATADAVGAALRHTSGLDWSAAVICLCKAVELEVVRCVAEPWRAATTGLDLSVDLKDTDLARMARYCAGRAPAPELGALSYSLGVAASSRARRETSPLVSSLWRLVGTRAAASWWVEATGLPAVLSDLSTRFRNPAAHTSVLTAEDYGICRAHVLGSDGILAQLMRAADR